MDTGQEPSSRWRTFLIWLSIPAFLLLCAGQGGHLWYISEPFFGGYVTTVVSEEVPERVPVLGLNVCKEIVNMTTIEDAWNQTPSVEELLAQAGEDELCGRVLCKDLRVRKYFFNRYVCHVIEVVHRKTRLRRRPALALYGSKDLIKYKINTTLYPAAGEFVIFLADFSLPALKYFEGELFSVNDISGKSFNLHSYSETRIRLPEYESNCFDYSQVECGDNWTCFIQCLEKYMSSNFNSSSLASTVYEPLPWGTLDPSKLVGKERKNFLTAFKSCNKRFPPDPCEDLTIFTNVYVDPKKSPEGVATLTWQLSKHPNKVTRDIPRISTVELFSFVQSSLGSWLSVNLIDIVPIHMYELIVSEESVVKEILKIVFILIPAGLFNLSVILFIKLPVRAFKLIKDKFVGNNSDAVIPFNDEHIQNHQNNLNVN